MSDGFMIFMVGILFLALLFWVLRGYEIRIEDLERRLDEEGRP